MEEKTNKAKPHPSATQRLLLDLKPGEVITSPHLQSMGISDRLAHYLKQTGALSSLGVGAYVRGQDEPHFTSALQALIKQLNFPIHVGGRTALSIHGVSQYLSMGDGQAVFLFCSRKLKLPLWFNKREWEVKPALVQTQFLNAELLQGTVSSKEVNGFSIHTSIRERAILEAIFLIGKSHRFEEIDEIFESLVTLDAAKVQVLLEYCLSIRVNRIFLFMAHKHRHPWLSAIDESKVVLGRGKRVAVKNGRLDSRYQITVPREEAESDV